MASTAVHYASIRDDSPCLIEDSAHRIEPNDPLTGLMRCYSFYATKNMTTGSGGMFVTDNPYVYGLARTYWKDGLTTSTAERQGGPVDYQVERMVSGYDGNDMAAVMGREQLKKLPGFTRRRNEIVRRYNKTFGQDWAGNHLYCYFVKDENEAYEMISFMKDKGIMCGHHYPGTGWNGVSLPIYPLLTDGEASQVIEAVEAYAAGLR